MTVLSFASSIKQTVSMDDVCAQYGIAVNRQHKALCPFHTDNHASMHVYPGERGFHCFVCEAGGSVIDFVKQYFGLDYHGAIEKINNDFHLGLPINEKLSRKKQAELNRAAYQRRKEIERKKAKLKLLESQYHAALDYAAALDIILERMDMLDAEWGVNELYCYALKHIDGAWSDATEAEAAYMAYRNAPW